MIAFARGTPLDPLVALLGVIRPRDRRLGIPLFQWTSKVDLLSKLGLTESALNYTTGGRASGSNEKTFTQVTTTSHQESQPTKQASTAEGDDLLPVAWTEEELKAVRTIIQYYQRYRRRAGGGAGGPLWNAYNQRASTLPESPQSAAVYKLYLRGVMPMVMTYIRRLIDRCEDAHRNLKARLSSAPHQQLDEIRGQTKVVR